MKGVVSGNQVTATGERRRWFYSPWITTYVSQLVCGDGAGAVLN